MMYVCQDIVGDKLCRLFDKQHEIDQAYAGKFIGPNTRTESGC